MKREFNKNDIGHLAKGKRVRGILNYNQENESYKDFTIRFKDKVKIIEYIKANDNLGGFVYDCEVEKDGIVYRIESIAQIELISKNMWEYAIQLENQIKELKNIKECK